MPYAIYAASRLGVPLTVVSVGVEEALGAVREVVGALGVFNPMEVVNCAAVYIALREAALWGYRRVCTGDGGDELYLGYGFLTRYEPEALEAKRREWVERWNFCSFHLGRRLGVEVEAPFTTPEAVAAALAVEARLALGKRPLREALREVLPLVAERKKAPVEEGSCFSTLYRVMREKAGDELAYLFAVYRELGLSYPTSPSGCPRCGYAEYRDYCKMCGYYGGK